VDDQWWLLAKYEVTLFCALTFTLETFARITFALIRPFQGATTTLSIMTFSTKGALHNDTHHNDTLYNDIQDNFLTPVLIRDLWQLKTVVFLHWCLKCAVLLQHYTSHYNLLRCKATLIKIWKSTKHYREERKRTSLFYHNV